MEEHLIEFVRQNRFLFDKDHKNYKNHRLRQKKFEELGKKLNIPVQKLKDRWRTLRDKYNKELKFSPTAQYRKWKWMDRLSFLTDVDIDNSQFSDMNVKEDLLDDLSDTEENSECDHSTVSKVSSPHLDSHKGIKRKGDDFNQSTIDLFNEKLRKANEMMLPGIEGEKSSVEIFFNGLAMQAKDAQLTNLEFTSLQIDFLQTFKSFLTKKSKKKLQQS